WNARNQLQSIAPVNSSGVPAASFAYDPLGRRAGKTIGASTTGFLYDGANFVQELSEANTAQAGTDANQANLIANLLTAGIDQTLLRQRLAATGTSITSSTPEHLLRDANNNTLGITNAATTPGLTTRYDYDAYGNVSQSTQTGTPSDNSQQYTGRENDPTGLMYYRARYYLPNCARFISEDPIGWASGQVNNYAYVGGDPISLVDPYGLCGDFWSDFKDQFSRTNDALSEVLPIPATTILSVGLGGFAAPSYRGITAGQEAKRIFDLVRRPRPRYLPWQRIPVDVARVTATSLINGAAVAVAFYGGVGIGTAISVGIDRFRYCD
ncbi:hypothetical protein IP84_17435, partial [beta proteobacterium AAP99]